jgi:hypothetical protein
MSLMMMMTNPITPPPELLDQWCMENNWRDIAIQAAQWGADQELEACCEWFVRDWTDIETADKLRAARRPKPLTDYKELCAELVTELEGWCGTGTYDNTVNAHSVIDRARAALAQSVEEGPSDAVRIYGADPIRQDVLDIAAELENKHD